MFKTSSVLVFFMVFFTGCSNLPRDNYKSALANDDRKDITDTAQDTLDGVVANAARAFFEAAPQSAGLSVGVVFGGEIKTYHFGTTSLGSNEPPTDKTIYAIASITKTVTGSLLAQAVLDKHLALDDDIRNHLNESFPNLEYSGQPVTIAHLINHLSGLPHIFPDLPEMRHNHPSYEGDVLQWMAFATEKLTNYEQEDFYRDLRAVQLDVIPGVHFSYSNVGVQLAGFILERVYDQPFQVLVDSLVTHPLEMKNTRLTLRPDEIERLATGYDDQGRPMPTDRTAAGAAGGLMSTISDLSKYARWHLDERDPVIELSHTMPEGDTNGPEMGLSWYIEHSQEGVRRLSSDGTVPGFSSRIVLYPELDIAAVVLTNQLDGAIPGLTDRLAHEVLESLNPQAFTYEEAR